jgi:hypothetical protein
LIKKHNITTEYSDDSRIGLSYDGGARSINKIVHNVNIHVQQYKDIIELHASPLVQYDVILGVPWHEMVDAHTHHRQRMITLSQMDSDGNATAVTLKQQRCDRRIQQNIHNNVSRNDSIMISAVQLKRWMRQRSSYENGVKVKQPLSTIYLIHINAIDENNEKQSDDSKYKQQYTSLYPDVCGDIPPGLPPLTTTSYWKPMHNQPINQHIELVLLIMMR